MTRAELQQLPNENFSLEFMLSNDEAKTIVDLMKIKGCDGSEVLCCGAAYVYFLYQKIDEEKYALSIEKDNIDCPEEERVYRALLYAPLDPSENEMLCSIEFAAEDVYKLKKLKSLARAQTYAETLQRVIRCTKHTEEICELGHKVVLKHPEKETIKFTSIFLPE